MGYKLINVKLVKGAAGTVAGTSYAHAWVNRLCQCNNFTLTSWQVVSGRYYYALLNDGDYCVSNGSPQSGLTSGLYIGLPKKGSGSYYCYGFYCYMDGAYDGSFYKMIVDEDNNLVYHSKMRSNYNGNTTTLGFMLTNGGVCNIDSTYLYAPSVTTGATPAQIATLLPDFSGSWKGNKDDFDIFISDMYGYDMNNNFIIRDHLKLIMSSNKNNIYIPNSVQQTASANAFETILIDGKKYIHLYRNMWIKIDEILDETIEVVNP